MAFVLEMRVYHLVASKYVSIGDETSTPYDAGGGLARGLFPRFRLPAKFSFCKPEILFSFFNCSLQCTDITLQTNLWLKIVSASSITGWYRPRPPLESRPGPIRLLFWYLQIVVLLSFSISVSLSSRSFTKSHLQVVRKYHLRNIAKIIKYLTGAAHWG